MLVVDIRTQHETADGAAGYKVSVLLSCAPSVKQLLGDSTKKPYVYTARKLSVKSDNTPHELILPRAVANSIVWGVL